MKMIDCYFALQNCDDANSTVLDISRYVLPNFVQTIFFWIMNFIRRLSFIISIVHLFFSFP
jgi:thymidylate synthase ThyX